ncbi:hypothetical protein HK098_000385 [Nowakowskiella sp. JEL0407]|nr:hypothetical protein HK098_000385 [Nowakowskiella sp. JEL0407]
MLANDDEIPIYGLDKELAEKQAMKYDPEREKAVREYIEAVTGEKFPLPGFQESLKDGVLLCKLMNKIQPEHPIKVSPSKMPFKQMENIHMFLDRCTKLGVPAYESFQTVDLYESKNMTQVVQCLYSVSRHAVAKGFTGPLLGPKLAQKQERQFTEEQIIKSKAAVPLLTAFKSTAGSTSSMGTVRQVYNPEIGTGDTTVATKLLSSKAEAEDSKNAGARFGGRREIGGKYLDIGNADAVVEGAPESAPIIQPQSESKSYVQKPTETPAKTSKIEYAKPYDTVEADDDEVVVGEEFDYDPDEFLDQYGAEDVTQQMANTKI